jgi:hypothetical protein
VKDARVVECRRRLGVLIFERLPVSAFRKGTREHITVVAHDIDARDRRFRLNRKHKSWCFSGRELLTYEMAVRAQIDKDGLPTADGVGPACANRIEDSRANMPTG